MPTSASVTEKYVSCSSFITVFDYPYKKIYNVHSKRDGWRLSLVLFSLAPVCLCLAVCMSSCQIWDIWSYNINITGDRAERISKGNHPAFLHII